MSLITAALLVALSLSGLFNPLTQKPTPTPTPTAQSEFATPEPLPTLPVAYVSESRGTMESDWEAAVSDMAALGLVDDTGELLFSEEMALEAFGNSGNGEATTVNVVMGALISIRDVDATTPGVCTFITRGIVDERGNPLAAGVVFTSNAEVIAVEQTASNRQPRIELVAEEDEGAFHDPVYVIVLVRGTTLSIWLNGDPLVEAWELEGDVPDEAYDEPVLTTVNPEPGCVMTGIWAYGF